MKKIINKKEGFSLIEVMIAVMVLGMAIVAGSSILTGLFRVNHSNLETLKAYYLAQEGIEMARNIRDTNWLNNVDFRGNDSVGIYRKMEKGKKYIVNLDISYTDNIANKLILEELDVMDELGVLVVGVEGEFYRYLEIEDACELEGYEDYHNRGECEDFILVRSVVNYLGGRNTRNVVLETVLTNWKN